MNDIGLSCEEVAQISAGLPDMKDWGNNILVPFEVRRLRYSKVFWVNQRWMFERGLDLSDASVASRLDRWLLDVFGFAVPGAEGDDKFYAEDTATFYADRYGSSSSTAKHGGSGRAAIVRCFQVKGIGVTPLTGIGCDWIHSNGCASLEEALREAIYAEVFDAEFPYGSVPVIAILDTGLSYTYRKPGSGEQVKLRRAIIVRPAVLRPAHAERVPLFKRSITGYCNSQVDDVQRCRDFIMHWQNNLGGGVCHIKELVRRFAVQIAFSEVHRLFSGGYFSSNLTLDGGFVDFGGARALPSWAYAIISNHAPGSGDGMVYLAGLIKSMVFYFNKYGRRELGFLAVQDLINDATEVYRSVFDSECARLWGWGGGGGLSDSLAKITRKYYLFQQKNRVDYAFDPNRGSWIYNCIRGRGAVNEDVERKVIEEVFFVFKEHLGADVGMLVRYRHHLRVTAMRFFKPRNDLERELLQRRIYKILDRFESNISRISALKVEVLLSNLIGRSRRHWPRLPDTFTVLSHVSVDGSSALLCDDIQSDDRFLWVEGVISGGRLRLFEGWVDESDVRIYGLRRYLRRWSAQIPKKFFRFENGRILVTSGAELPIPRFQVNYAVKDADFICEMT